MGTNHNTITLPEAIAAISSYNSGVYKGRRNVDIDNEARQLFLDGLGKTPSQIKDQVRFIGQDYGGTGFTLAGQQLPDRIAQEIYSARDEYAARTSSASPLVGCVPDQELVRFLYHPFEQVFKSPKGKRTFNNWLTWGTKFWHFLNPETFPMRDSRAKRFFSVTDRSNPIQTYCEYLEIFRASMISHQGWFPRLRQVDDGQAWNDVKLWDKVAYEAGAK